MLDEDGGLPSSLVIASHRGILKPVQQLKGLRKFWLFLHELCEMEEMAEKEVMGGEYDSGKEGKLELRKRSFASPHEGWRDPEPDEATEFDENVGYREDGGVVDGWENNEDESGDW